MRQGRDKGESQRKMSPTPPPDGAPVADRHTAIGICLNLLLLMLIGYGYSRSEDYKWAWVLVAVPIAVVTLRYAWHLVRSRS